MKKTLLFISAFVFGLALRAQHIDSLSFSMTQISLTTENGYTRVFMQSCDITTDIGYPELPCLELKYVLPYNQEISSITILDSSLQLISNNTLVYPRQPDYPIDDTTTHAFILPDEIVYNNNTPFFRICNSEASDMSICNAEKKHSQSIGSYGKRLSLPKLLTPQKTKE